MKLFILIFASIVGHAASQTENSIIPLENVNTTTTGTSAINVTSVQTTGPTESPAPSPNPSSAPSPAPSGTYTPTARDTLTPTESPAPSPNPTTLPSFSPSMPPSNLPSITPSNVPTTSPSKSPSRTPSQTPSISKSPTLGPTLSLVPSNLPSHSPSRAPSQSPSIAPSDFPSASLAPSTTPTTGAPSVSPSSGPPSRSPSRSPSNPPSIYSAIMDTIIGVTLDLHDPLGPELQAVFEEQCKEFIETQWETDIPLMQGVNVTIINLKITDQTVIPARRVLRDGRDLHQAGLRIRFNVTGEVKPGNPPPEFFFTNEVARPFRDNYAMFIFRLYSVNEAFQGLVNGDDTNPNSLSTDIESAPPAKVSAGAVAGITIASVGSVLLAVFAGIYAIKSKKSSDSVAHKPILDIYQIEQNDSHSTMMTPYNDAGKLSPQSLEAGRASDQFRTNPKSLLDDMISRNESDEDARDSSSDLGLKLSGAVLGAHALQNDVNRLSCSTRGSDPPEISQNPLGARPAVKTVGVGSLCYSDDDSTTCGGTPNSVQLTPAALDTPSSVFSGLAHLGARPMESTEQMHFHIETGSVGSSTLDAPSVKRSGLYDVFAPSGPLGIVVDTTRDGPVVHSMKPTSPLLGLITPGDLIVGLDDMDTRSMTAATLTRLMAKRAHQAERKITLLAFDGASTVN